MFDLKKGLASLAIAGTLLGTSAVGVLAAPPASNGPQTAAADAVVSQVTTLVGQGGLIDVNDTLVQVGLVNVSKSLNSAQILNNVLNNSPILNNLLMGSTILSNNEILKDITLTDFLNDNNVVLSDVVSVAVLSGGDVIVFTR